jgi:hypothetical protein
VLTSYITAVAKAIGRDSSVGIATAYELGGQGFEVRVPVEVGFFPLPIVQTGSRAHQASHPMDSGSSFPRRKTAGVWSWPLPTSAEVKNT